MSDKWYAYVLLCDDGSLYKGHTDNLTRRHEQHCNGWGSIHTKRHKPIRIVYHEEFDSQSQAVARERYFKSGAGREWLKAHLEGELLQSMKKDKREISIVRSSAAEYLTFVASTGDSKESIEMRYEDENIWLTQKMMAVLYDVDVRTVNEHIQKIYADDELTMPATIRKFRIVQTEGMRQVSREVKHYSLQMIIAVGFKVNNERAVQFRKWSNSIVKDYTIQGWVMDEERLKNDGSVLTKEYFEKQLERIREIRLSERKFYQKITDIYTTALDYDPSAKATQRFFAAVQNKLHYSVHGHTAAEVIYHRADAQKEYMGLTSWDGSPKSKIHRYDVTVAKNYLIDNELRQLERIVSAYLDMAEMQAERHIPMTMADWEQRLNRFLTAWDREILQDAGKVSAELAQAHALSEFEKFRVVQDHLYQSDFDRMLLEEATPSLPAAIETETDKDGESE